MCLNLISFHDQLPLVIVCTKLLEFLVHAGHNKLEIHTDSKHLIECVTDFMPKWKQNGYQKFEGGPVVNKDLLVALDNVSKDVHIDYVSRLV